MLAAIASVVAAYCVARLVQAPVAAFPAETPAGRSLQRQVLALVSAAGVAGVAWAWWRVQMLAEKAALLPPIVP